ncbi:hypothetical protein CDL12_15577 [Handroanthus impetiginosus]|uniref:Uncharacterized protein n=1 Tax=Handroanthus impetiginosus TaxID=429701 RepID=A0A2G9H2U1_9LAMI|nr:hypothetical protein CDL12_15577 [Handroanthus impetiginosus]
MILCRCTKTTRDSCSERREERMLILGKTKEACLIPSFQVHQSNNGVFSERREETMFILGKTKEACLIPSFQVHQSNRVEFSEGREERLLILEKSKMCARLLFRCTKWRQF